MVESEISKQYRQQGAQVYAWLLLEWLQDPQRKPAQVAFTEGPTRTIAALIEHLLANERDVPGRKYAALLASLQTSGEVPRGVSYLPVLTDPLDPTVTYTREGFDALMDQVLRDL